MPILRHKTKFLLGIQSPEQLEQWLVENPTCQGVAFIGRSNVGKSSLINAFFGNNTAKTSKTPGRTRQVNIFSFVWQDEHENEFTYYLFDVPGYGHAEVSKAMAKLWEQLLNLFFELLSQRVLLLNIQDARHPLQRSDEQFHKYIKSFNLETFLVLNKIDKLKNQKERNKLKKLMPEIYKKFKWVKQIHLTSAEKKEGIEPLEFAMINSLKKES